MGKADLTRPHVNTSGDDSRETAVNAKEQNFEKGADVQFCRHGTLSYWERGSPTKRTEELLS